MSGWWYNDYTPAPPRDVKLGIKAFGKGGFAKKWWGKRWIEVLESQGTRRSPCGWGAPPFWRGSEGFREAMAAMYERGACGVEKRYNDFEESGGKR